MSHFISSQDNAVGHCAEGGAQLPSPDITAIIVYRNWQKCQCLFCFP